MTVRIDAFQTLLRGFVILSSADLTTSLSPKKVSLTWKRDGGHLCFSCDVKNLSLGVSFEDPHGNTRGHCTAPIPHTVAGHCDSHLKQNIFNETTVLMVDRIDCENGLWKCFHGENTNEYATASVSVSVDSKEKKAKDSKDIENISGLHRYLCAFSSSAIGYIIALVLFLLLALLVQMNVGCCSIQFWTTDPFLTRLEVVIPLLIICVLSGGFMEIHGICKGQWWIAAVISATITFVVLLISGYFRKKSPAASNSSSSKGDQSLLLDSDSNGHRKGSNLELKELKDSTDQNQPGSAITQGTLEKSARH